MVTVLLQENWKLDIMLLQNSDKKGIYKDKRVIYSSMTLKFIPHRLIQVTLILTSVVIRPQVRVV